MQLANRAVPAVCVDVDDDRIADLRRWSDDPSAVLALNSSTAAFRSPRLPGFIAYRRAGHWLIQVGGVHAPPTHRADLLGRFSRYAAAEGCRVMAVQLQAGDAAELAAAGFTVNQIGASYALPVESFTLRGGRHVRLRNKISRATRAGVRIEMSTFADLLPAEVAAMRDLDRQWLRAKGRFTRPLALLVGELGGPAARLRRLVLARLGQRVIGYLSLSPVFGSRPGWLHDLSRRAADAPPGVMELLVAQCLQTCRDEGVPWWHFGFTPFTALDPTLALPGASRTVDRLTRLLAEHGQRLYPAATQADYKRKWGDLLVLPDYIAFDGRPRPTGVVQLLRATNMI